MNPEIKNLIKKILLNFKFELFMIGIFGNVIWIRNIYVINSLKILVEKLKNNIGLGLETRNISIFFFKILIMQIAIYIYSFYTDKYIISSKNFIYKEILHDIIKRRENRLSKTLPYSIYSNIKAISLDMRTLIRYSISLFPNILLQFALFTKLYQINKIIGTIFFLLYFILGKIIWTNLPILYKHKEKLITSYNSIINKNQDINKNLVTINSFNNLKKEKSITENLVKKFVNNNNIYSFTYNKIKAIYYSFHIIILVFSIKFIKNNQERNFFFLVFYFILYNCNKIIGSILDTYLYYISLNLNHKIIFQDFPKADTLTIRKQIFNKNIKIQNLNNHIFNNLNLNLVTNETSILIGEIGSGKSSLLKALFNIEKTKSGKITFQGICSQNPKWKDNIHYCEQFPNLFSRSLDSNIFYGQKNKNSFNKLINKFKIELKNLETLDCVKLSNGQKQVITLLRVAINPKPIVILDEPTSSVDALNKIIIYKIIRHLQELNTTLIIATHDLKLVEMGNTIIQLDKGKIIKQKKNMQNLDISL
ncbi:ABC transporter [seawater metagenome]|uniref:ABC transporter n=1 Tax=seawater metagenome TaxID=1561972 RepID=A0A5E8CM66_9ZZZZ